MHVFLLLTLFCAPAEPQYWYYANDAPEDFPHRPGLYYSNVLNCTHRVETPGFFSPRHAEGPYKTYRAAQDAQELTVKRAREAGKNVYYREVVCDDQWVD